jgi:hypothetical protein
VALERYIFERKQEVEADDLRPGEYTQTSASTTGHCVVACPKCGTLAVILRHMHAVSWAGEVSPGVTCPGKCTLAAMIRLEDWVPEAKGQA